MNILPFSKNIYLVGITLTLVTLFSLINHQQFQAEEQGHPTHYIIFQQSGNIIAPLQYAEVSLSTNLTSLTADEIAARHSLPSRNQRHYTVKLIDAETDQLVYQTVVDAPRWVRGEFAKDDTGTIDSTYFEETAPSFVVRVPKIPNTELHLEGEQLSNSNSFNMQELVNNTQAIIMPPTADLKTQSDAGNPANRVDILVLGDGYQSGEEGTFDAMVSNLETDFFDIPPYSTHKNHFNIVSLFVESNDSGMDHPIYSPTCNSLDATCCSASQAQTDPLAGSFQDTAFDGTLCNYNTYRLTYANVTKVYAAAAAYPDWDQILLVFNDTTYGGAGGAIAQFTSHSVAVEIAKHEIGHSLYNLADEYSSAFPGYPPCSDTGSFAPCEDNVTDETERDFIKWGYWIASSTPIPTTGIMSNGIPGLYEGARYQATDMYRPEYNCLMRSLGQPFCNVVAESIVLTHYDGGWGVPVNGINMIEPASTTPAQSSSAIAGTPVQFQADILEPVGGPPAAIEWVVDGTLVQTDGETFTHTFPTEGVYTVILQVKDETTLVHPHHESSLEFSYTWSVDVEGVPTAVGFANSDASQSVVGVLVMVSVILMVITYWGLGASRRRQF